MLEFNPFQKIGKEWMLITAGNRGKANTMTASWGGVGVMWGKNVVFAFIRDTRYTKEFVDKEGTFSLTFFDKSYRSALKYLGAVSGRDEDKLAGARMNLDYYEDGTPYVDEGNLVIVCKKLSATRITKEQLIEDGLMEQFYADENMHTMYIGEIIGVLAR